MFCEVYDTDSLINNLNGQASYRFSKLTVSDMSTVSRLPSARSFHGKRSHFREKKGGSCQTSDISKIVLYALTF